MTASSRLFHSHQKKPFKLGVTLLLLAMVLMVMDHRVLFVKQWHDYFFLMASPVPYKSVAMTTDNQALQEQLVAAMAEHAHFQALAEQNESLRAALQLKQEKPWNTQAALVESLLGHPVVQQWVLNKGSEDAVVKGEAVVAIKGVVGQVIDVAANTSRVLLLTAKTSRVPVRDVRSGVRAVAAGNGQSSLLLRNLPKTADVQLGDVWVTSGMDAVYPADFPVATVVRVDRQPHSPGMLVRLTPTADLLNTAVVLLVGKSHA